MKNVGEEDEAVVQSSVRAVAEDYLARWDKVSNLWERSVHSLFGTKQQYSYSGQKLGNVASKQTADTLIQPFFDRVVGLRMAPISWEILVSSGGADDSGPVPILDKVFDCHCISRYVNVIEAAEVGRYTDEVRTSVSAGHQERPGGLRSTSTRDPTVDDPFVNKGHDGWEGFGHDNFGPNS